MLLCTNIRLQLSAADADAVEFMRGKCRGLYNWWVLRLRAGERWPGWREAKATLEASKKLEIMEERYTTQECSHGHRRQEMPLWKRTYRCGNPNCGLVMDRDENSAINILQRFLARRGPPTGDPVRCAEVFTAINTL